MIDVLSIVLTHGLMLMLAWRLLSRDELDVEAEALPDSESAGDGPQKPARRGARPWLANQKYLANPNDRPEDRKSGNGGQRDA